LAAVGDLCVASTYESEGRPVSFDNRGILRVLMLVQPFLLVPARAGAQAGFKGKIGRTLAESVPDYPEPLRARRCRHRMVTPPSTLST
jgi:hypothetical protein